MQKSLSLKTEATIATFFMFMTRYPQFAKRAQEEIDLHVGKERLPTIEDRKDLPYIDCIMRELLRRVVALDDMYRI